MTNRRQPRDNRTPRRPPFAKPEPESRWAAIADWLGAQRPINLILGAVVIIVAVLTLARLA